jgi:SAM-dependent methyltransferase
MEKALKLLEVCLENLNQVSFSSPKKKGELKNIVISPLKNKEEFKVEFRHKKHNDIKTLKRSELDLNLYIEQFKQILSKTSTHEHQILLNKKNESKIISKEISAPKTTHNREKNYFIPDKEICPFLTEIGVMDSKGNVKANQYKKFRQINRFLEMLDDLYKKEDQENFHIVDFGCGKSYLTFAVYHYFKNIRNKEVTITGVDLKQEVIDHCNEIAIKLNFNSLKFVHGFIHDFKVDTEIDLVITLHACDTATDDAILFSLDHDAKKMMFVPCCQHELNKQLENQESAVLLKHGIFRDRMCALVTDTMRTQLLEGAGYKVQSMEFIDLAHTAKNILLRCIKTEKSAQDKQKAIDAYLEFKAQWKIAPYLEKELIKRKYL